VRVVQDRDAQRAVQLPLQGRVRRTEHLHGILDASDEGSGLFEGQSVLGVRRLAQLVLGSEALSLDLAHPARDGEWIGTGLEGGAVLRKLVVAVRQLASK